MPSPTASPDRQAETADRGHQIYDAQIRSQVEADNHGEIVAIDVLTGDFAIAIDIEAVTGGVVTIQALPDR
jgi:hypothetical protein